ncbi:MAG: hypothetical protein KDD11_23245 [Acidobacteria bacterium]|nr:hypothetical protein [Acidobacteriota bacterium]
MNTLLESEADVGRSRPIVARWVVTGTLKLESAAHFGGIEDPAVDLKVQRDAVSGAPLLPGTSLAGALRGYLSDVLQGYRSQEDDRVSMLLGGQAGDDQGSQSPLIVFDSRGHLPQDLPYEIRDGVKIDAASGTAEKHKKFEREILPAGTCFGLRFELVVAEGGKKEKLQLSLLARALEGLERAEISLGARRSRGFGKARAIDWRVRRFDLTDAEGWLRWLLSDGEAPVPDSVPRHGSVRSALETTLGDDPPFPLEAFQDERTRCSLEMDLVFESGLLVRSPGSDVADPDAVHLHSAGGPVLPGTSVAGALRARATKILGCVRREKNDADAWIDRLFGPSLKGTVSPDFKPEASRLWLGESVIEAFADQQQTRVGIDRFTQGVVSGVFLEEQPVVAAELAVRLELRKPEPGEIGLLVLLAKDLITGDLPLGGTSSVGRGVAQGSARLDLAGRETLTFSMDRAPEDDAVKNLQAWIDELIKAPVFEASNTKKGAPA